MSESEALVVLRRSFDGSLIFPGDDGFEDARKPWNLSIEQRPAAVARPAHLDDLRRLLGAARDAGLTVAVQPRGHGAGGDLEGAVLVRMDRFDELAVDHRAHVVRVGAGVQWGRVVDALEGSGWAAPSGSSPVVSVAGYTLGGGHSWLSRTAGLGSDNLRAAWVLRVDGTHERIDDDSDPEAMWALRGAGGIVGIVTALEIDLVPTPALWGASLTFDAADTAAAIRAVRDLSASAPQTLNVFMNSMRMPDAPQLPAEIRGKSFLTVQALSSAGDAGAHLAGVRAVGARLGDTSGPTSPATLVAQSTEPTEPTAGRGASIALGNLDDAAIEAVAEFRQRPEQWPIIGIEFRMLGGALGTPRRAGFARLESANWLVYALAPLFPGSPAAAGDASLTGFREVFPPGAVQRTVPTFLGPGQTLDLAGSAADIDRLRATRRRLDPDGVLHEGRLPRR